ncbi:hypothetical protein D3C71_1260240 [compost metagenome]
MLTTTLWRYGSNRSFENLQKCLLYTFTGYVTGNGRVLGFTCHFINLINIDNAAFGFLHIIICRLNQLKQNVLNILADITSFR